MGLSSKSETSTVNQNTNTDQTQTPIVPDWGVSSLQELNSRINALGQQSPGSYVSPATPDQNAAFTGAASLGDWQPNMGAAGSIASAIAGRPASTVGGAALSSASQLPGVAQTSAAGYQAPTINGVAKAQGSSYDPVGYVAPNAVGTQVANVTNTGSTGYDPQGYKAALMGSASVAPTVNAGTRDAASAGVFDKGIGGYMNPFVQNVVKSSLSDYDQNAAVTRAQQAAQAAGNNAFAGSRYGLREAETEGQLARGRGALESGLLSSGYDTATNLANQDAARRQQTGLANSAASDAASSQNAAAANSRAQSIAEFLQQAMGNNQNALNQAGAFNATAGNQAGAFTAAASNAAASQNATAQNQLNQFRANLEQNNNQFNTNNQIGAAKALADAQNQAGEFGASANNAASSQNATMQNSIAAFLAGQQADAGRFNATSQNDAANLNAQAENAAAAHQADLNTAVSGQNAAATNQIGEFNANANNDASGRALSAASTLGQIGNDQGNQQRLDVAAQLAAGGAQRDINQAGATAPISLAQAIAGLLGQNQLPLLTGQHQTGTSTMNGTQTTTSNPSLLESIGSGLSLASSIAGLFAGIPGLGAAGGGGAISTSGGGFLPSFASGF